MTLTAESNCYSNVSSDTRYGLTYAPFWLCILAPVDFYDVLGLWFNINSVHICLDRSVSQDIIWIIYKFDLSTSHLDLNEPHFSFLFYLFFFISVFRILSICVANVVIIWRKPQSKDTTCKRR